MQLMHTSTPVPPAQMSYPSSWRTRKQFCIRPRNQLVFIPDDNMTVAVMFSVPFDRNLYENWWDAKVYRNKTEADYNLWSFMYYNHNPFRGDDAWKLVGCQGLSQ